MPFQDEDIPKPIEELIKQGDVSDESTKVSSQSSNGTSTDTEQVTPGRSLLKSKVQNVVEDDDDLPAMVRKLNS